MYPQNQGQSSFWAKHPVFHVLNINTFAFKYYGIRIQGAFKGSDPLNALLVKDGPRTGATRQAIFRSLS